MSKREREYTPEEAYALTMRDALPHWYGSSPLVVGVDLHDHAYPQPLDPSVSSGSWIFVFVSATGVEFNPVVEIYSAWLKRFRSLGLNFVFVFRGHYAYFQERRVTEAWVKSLGFDTPMVCDMNGSLGKAFGVSGEPGVALLQSGKIIFSESGPRWIENAEKHIQIVLRENSPGLSLWPALQEPATLRRTTDRWLLRTGSKAILGKQVELFGNWEIDADRVLTADPKAELRFTAPASSVKFVARCMSETGDPTRVRFDSEGTSFSDHFGGKDFQSDDEGNSCLLLKGPRAYDVLHDLTVPLRKLHFSFPFAKVNPVALYGLEFGDPVGQEGD